MNLVLRCWTRGRCWMAVLIRGLWAVRHLDMSLAHMYAVFTCCGQTSEQQEKVKKKKKTPTHTNCCMFKILNVNTLSSGYIYFLLILVENIWWFFCQRATTVLELHFNNLYELFLMICIQMIGWNQVTFHGKVFSTLNFVVNNLKQILNRPIRANLAFF